MVLLPHAPTETTLAQAALDYARAGLPVFPLRPQDKVPLVKHGVYAATTHEEQIARWWRRFPQANIGLPTGLASARIVLDVDPRHGGLVSLEHLQQDIHHRSPPVGFPTVSPLAPPAPRPG